jgi:AcrR family transcriptional regulator
MPRTTPPDRLEKLLDVAAATFVMHGFQRTQMDDIAVGLGVSKGTIYRSVESKEALLAAVINYADTPDRLPRDGLTATGDIEHVSTMLNERLASAGANLHLTAAVLDPAKARPGSPSEFSDEIERIVLDLYRMLERHRIQIMVLDRCAPELPKLAGDWYEAGRYALVDMWSAYLAQRTEHIADVVDQDVLARTIVELITMWAVKMPWDPAPRPYPTNLARHCAAMIRNLVIGTNT